MESALPTLLVAVPRAVAVWSTLLLVVGVAVALLTRGRPVGRRRITAAEADLQRRCEEAALAIEAAAETSRRCRSMWEVAQGELDAAWQAYDRADRLAREAAKACAYPLMSRRRKPGENADRQRYLHHAATAACRQRDLSIDQLNDVLAHRGWNPRLHPVVQEAALRQAVREHRLSGYLATQLQERTTWREAEAAAETLRKLRRDLAVAGTPLSSRQPTADELRWADTWTTGELPAVA